MMLVVPIYLFNLKGVYNVEPFRDLSWGIFSYAINMVYHFAILQPLALLSEVNLNQLLCPAQKDPFRGSYYRSFAVFHQSLLCPLLGKAMSIFASYMFSSTTVNAEFSFDHKHQVLNTLSCDNNLCAMTEEEPSQTSSAAECRSCCSKDKDYVSNLNHDVDKLNSQITGLENLHNSVHDSMRLRQRRKLNENEDS